MREHQPSFTLDVYSHMLDDGYGDPLDLDAELAPAGATHEVEALAGALVA